MEWLIDLYHPDNEDLCDLLHAKRPLTVPQFYETTLTEGSNEKVKRAPKTDR
jgi:hypothetical protein